MCLPLGIAAEAQALHLIIVRRSAYRVRSSLRRIPSGYAPPGTIQAGFFPPSPGGGSAAHGLPERGARSSGPCGRETGARAGESGPGRRRCAHADTRHRHRWAVPRAGGRAPGPLEGGNVLRGCHCTSSRPLVAPLTDLKFRRCRTPHLWIPLSSALCGRQLLLARAPFSVQPQACNILSQTNPIKCSPPVAGCQKKTPKPFQAF